MMRWTRKAALVCAALAVAACENDGAQTHDLDAETAPASDEDVDDVAEHDASVEGAGSADARTVPDAAGSTSDAASPSMDGGLSDAAPAFDAGSDADVAPDASVMVDASLSIDATNPADSGQSLLWTYYEANGITGQTIEFTSISLIAPHGRGVSSRDLRGWV